RETVRLARDAHPAVLPAQIAHQTRLAGCHPDRVPEADQILARRDVQVGGPRSVRGLLRGRVSWAGAERGEHEQEGEKRQATHAGHSSRPMRSRKRSFHTSHAASMMMRRFIFEMPARRSTNTIGISLMRKPRFQQRNDISIWNP